MQGAETDHLWTPRRYTRGMYHSDRGVKLWRAFVRARRAGRYIPVPLNTRHLRHHGAPGTPPLSSPQPRPLADGQSRLSVDVEMCDYLK